MNEFLTKLKQESSLKLVEPSEEISKSFLIKRINLNEDDIDLVLDTKGLRERACYGTNTTFESSLAKHLQIQTAEFVNKIRTLLE